MERIRLLRAQMEEAYTAIRRRVDGLGEAEYHWEPAPGGWRVYRLADGTWTYDYEEPDPEPAPFTTIAWRLVHVATCKVMYHEWAFGPREMTWDTIVTPASPDEAVEMMERGQALLVGDLDALSDDAALDAPAMTNWGEEWPAWKIFWTMIWHDAHHGGEIGALRDLYRVTVAADGSPSGEGGGSGP